MEFKLAFSYPDPEANDLKHSLLKRFKTIYVQKELKITLKIRKLIFSFHTIFISKHMFSLLDAVKFEILRYLKCMYYPRKQKYKRVVTIVMIFT